MLCILTQRDTRANSRQYAPILGQNCPQGCDQNLALRIRPDRNAQELRDARRVVEMPHDNAALAQSGGKLGAAMLAMPREHKICG